ncbi:MAG: nicotinate (nicotinamide) nucleotide adenylyltransferase [Alysiella sp.]|uniref:nicotinate (nicotinamide) nucleotide adenylyltransferase n=1 Tax=Alysiella sp. TaxID=1872483 RepID=UPI0026DDC5C2|nr:nicotinate (nicotinamide) nucleotide adenylyltransferase [Alysiella sp.]MDO4432970.1 nicotinate (nicotinamide) nucleotide adenylyltransferase [Alysiella sp.]
MKNIGLFGGTFDPIHKGHLHIAQAFMQKVQPDTLVFLPAGNPYHKNTPHVSASHRLAMLEIAIADEPKFAVSDLDIIREGATYAIDTVHIFRQHYPHAQLWYLMGMDSLLQLHTWKNWTTLVKQVHIAVATRPNQSFQKAPSQLHTWLGNALHDGSLLILDAHENPTSSTQIRTDIQTGKIPHNMLPEKVAHYIQQHSLYNTKQDS